LINAHLPELKVFLALLHFPVYTLGPGTRVGLWLQGCTRRCPGCAAPETWDFLPEKAVPLEDLVRRIGAFFAGPAGPDGLTISGGEPFDQPGALKELLQRLGTQDAPKVEDVLIYSGYRVETLLERHPEFFADPPLTAALVDGSFEKGNVTDVAWKGSENQGLTIWKKEFSQRYQEWAKRPTRRLQRVKDGGTWFLLGIPRQEDVPRLKDPYMKETVHGSCKALPGL
jgi:anaerobic ribonucleoside-triphosphate reductase activating protein